MIHPYLYEFLAQKPDFRAAYGIEITAVLINSVVFAKV